MEKFRLDRTDNEENTTRVVAARQKRFIAMACDSKLHAII